MTRAPVAGAPLVGGMRVLQRAPALPANRAPRASARHRTNAPTIAAIQHHAAARSGLAVGDLTSACKERRATRARHIAMWLSRALTHHGATAIGRAFGRRDRSTVTAAWRGLERRLTADAELKAKVEALRVTILAAGRAQASDDPTLQQFALAAFDRARIVEAELARWRSTNAALLAALEAGGHVEGDVPDGIAPPAPDESPIGGDEAAT